MSGGVDSSVAALLLRKQGYNLVGCYIKGWYPPGIICSWKEDRRDAMRVCAKLGIPFITIDAEKEYKKEVADYMISEYKAGRTPNPDIMCNKHIKFGVFLKKALAMGADHIATGHYVKIEKGRLKIAKDLNKDQSYFLWTLTQEQLKHCLFPIGDLLKSEVREIAKKHGLATAEKEESQGVCFIGEFNMEDFLKKSIKPKKGKVVNEKKETIGTHDGLAFYTIGQRRGFGFKGGAAPYYVVAKDFKKNILVAAEKAAENKFAEKEVAIMDANWISGFAPDKNKKYKARIRYRQPLEECKIRIKNQELRIKEKRENSNNILIHNSEFVILFDNPQKAVTPGQSLVIYDGEELAGGGIIV